MCFLYYIFARTHVHTITYILIIQFIILYCCIISCVYSILYTILQLLYILQYHNSYRIIYCIHLYFSSRLNYILSAIIIYCSRIITTRSGQLLVCWDIDAIIAIKKKIRRINWKFVIHDSQTYAYNIYTSHDLFLCLILYSCTILRTASHNNLTYVYTYMSYTNDSIFF